MTQPNAPVTPVEWTDHHGDVWEESPVDRQMLRLARFANGDVVTEGHYWPFVEIERQWGELIQTTGAPPITEVDLTCGRRWVAEIALCYRCGQNAEAHSAVNALPITDDDESPLGSTVVNVLPDGSTVVDVIEDGVPAKNPEPIERPEFDTFTHEQKKLVESAAELENISVMVKEAVLDLRNAARVGDVADAYARVYFLRRELGRVVAGLGAGVPRNLAAVETEYRELTQG